MRLKNLKFATLFLILLGCKITEKPYDRLKLIDKYSENYQFEVDSKESKLDSLFLDKENIKYVRVNNIDKKVEIEQIEKRKLIELSGFIKDSITLIVIDGIPFDETSSKNVLIDLKAIEKIDILKDIGNINLCRTHKKVMLIKTK